MTTTLALLEHAPDRHTAELMLLAALHEGVGADALRVSWRRWQHSQVTPARHVGVVSR